MSIGRTIRLLASLATAMLLASAEVLVTTIGLVRSTAAAAEPPNIVLVVTDDLTKRDYFDLGNNLSSFTSGGTFFHNAFVTTALCSPSRASTLTNLYAHNHHIHQHIDPGTGYEQYHAEGYDQKDLPVWLKDSENRRAGPTGMAPTIQSPTGRSTKTGEQNLPAGSERTWLRALGERAG
jgi:hypothetical protein